MSNKVMYNYVTGQIDECVTPRTDNEALKYIPPTVRALFKECRAMGDSIQRAMEKALRAHQG